MASSERLKEGHHVVAMPAKSAPADIGNISCLADVAICKPAKIVDATEYRPSKLRSSSHDLVTSSNLLPKQPCTFGIKSGRISTELGSDEGHVGFNGTSFIFVSWETPVLVVFYSVA